MIKLSLPTVMKDTILHDVIQRDLTTARRVALLEILWNERYLTAGYRLLYSRKKEQPGYYLAGQAALSSEFKQVLKGSMVEVDQRQINIYRKLSFAARFHQGCSISDTARNVVAYRIRQENPRLSVAEANRMALQRAYSP
jgi:hypothetical protein